MANPIPVWKENDSKEETESEPETEEEECGDDDSKGDRSKENSDIKRENLFTKIIKEGFEGTPAEIKPPPQEGLKKFEEKQLDPEKENDENIDKHSHKYNPSFEEEIDNEPDFIKEEEKEYQEDFKNPDFEREVENIDDEDDSMEEEIENEEEEEEDNFEDIEFEYPDKSIEVDEKSDPDLTESELLKLFDGKEGEPDPYAFAPLDIARDVKIGDERWKEMMEQIIYKNPYEDYVPRETKPPHEAIWERWDRTDFNEGRWMDDTEFDDSSIPTDFKIDFEELRRLAKELEEGKSIRTDY